MGIPFYSCCIILFSLITQTIAGKNFDPYLRLTLIPLESFLSPNDLEEKYGYGKWQQQKPKEYDYDMHCLEEANLPHWVQKTDWSQCSDTCGGCGKRWRLRECHKKKPECGDCDGSEREEQICNFHVCLYPRQPSCCGQLVPSSMGGNFTCALL